MSISHEIAIIGVSAIAPESNNATELWRNIVNGKDCIKDVPENRWIISDYYNSDRNIEDTVYCKRGGFINAIPFEPLEYGIPPANIQLTDTTQLLALIAAKYVLQDCCRGSYANIDLSNASVILGVTSAQELLVSMASRIQRPIWRKALKKLGLSDNNVELVCQTIADQYVPWKENTFPGLLGNVVSGRIANRFNFGGTNCITDAACASAFSALSMGVNELLLHQADLVISGGADTLNDIFMYMCFAQTTALSFSGVCRPFDENSDGTLLGEAICLFAMKRLADAETNGDPIYAVIKGIGTSSDGKAKSIYAPLARGQAVALNRAYKQAKYSPATVELVEAHGTGTMAGDKEEFIALTTVFNQDHTKQWCALGSIKSQVGHTKATAGALGLFKIVMALLHKTYPPTINVTQPNSNLDFKNSPFYLNTRARPWIKASQQGPRRASVSSFGFGGTNFHITVEEYSNLQKQHGRLRSLPCELLLVSGIDKQAIIKQLSQWQQQSSLPMAQLAKESQMQFKHDHPCRMAVVIDATVEVKDHLAKIIAEFNTPDKSNKLNIFYSEKILNGKIAFLFAGQNSQRLYMGDQLAMYFEQARTAWDEVANIELEPQLYLHSLVFPPLEFSETAQQQYEQRLNETAATQASLAVHAHAQYRLLHSLGIESDYLIGHSYGEFLALSAAGLFDLSSLVKLGWERGKAMNQYAPATGGMLAILAPIETMIQKIASLNLNLSIVNFNSAQQCVVSGDNQEIEQLSQLLNNENIINIRLKSKHAIHTHHMNEAAAHFKQYLTQVAFSSVKKQVVTNANAELFPNDPQQQIEYLANHMATPVQFIKQLKRLYDDNVRYFIEISPKKVLQNFVMDTLPNNDICAVSLGSSDGNEIQNLFEALAKLAVNGVPLNYAGLWENYTTNLLATTPEVTSNTVMITGSNYNKPYPPGKFNINPDESLNNTQTNTSDQLLQWAQQAENNLKNLYEELSTKLRLDHEAIMNAGTQPKKIAEPVIEESKVEEQEIPLEIHLPPPPAAMKLDSAIQYTNPIKPEVMQQPVTQPRIDDVVAQQSVIEPQIKPEVLQQPMIEPQINNKPHHTSAANDQFSIQLVTSMKRIIAEKTGFSADMIKEAMSLEADLGIDSIKRVEILAAIRKEIPNLPMIDPTELGVLNTIQEILNTFERHHNSASSSTPAELDKKKIDQQPLIPNTWRSLVVPIESPLPHQPIPKLLTGQITIVAKRSPIAQELLTQLQAQHLNVQLMSELHDKSDVVIYLGGLEEFSDDTHAIESNRTAFLFAKQMITSLSNGCSIVFVQNTAGEFGNSLSELRQAWSGGLTGLAKTIKLEFPTCCSKVIDIDCRNLTAPQIAVKLANELLNGAQNHEIGIRNDKRIQLQSIQKHNSPNSHQYLTQQSVILVSGGARGITAQCLMALSKKLHPKIVLLGRTPLQEESQELKQLSDTNSIQQLLIHQQQQSIGEIDPKLIRKRVQEILAAREVAQTIATLRNNQCIVDYYAVDIMNATQLHEVVTTVKSRYGSIDGIIHASGVLADKLIADKSLEQFDTVFNTKIIGLKNLLNELLNEPLKLIVFFSSIAARYGNIGQSDYAMANEVMNRIAHVLHQQYQDRCLVKSINWSPWDSGMVTEDLKRYFLKKGIQLLPTEIGIELFVSELLATNADEVEVILGPDFSLTQ